MNPLQTNTAIIPDNLDESVTTTKEFRECLINAYNNYANQLIMNCDFTTQTPEPFVWDFTQEPNNQDEKLA